MKTWIKRILIGLVIVVVAAVAGLAVFLLTFDPNAYKSRLEELVQQRFHRTLTIDGDIEMSLLPRIGLTLQGVSLSEPGSDDVFASIDSARMSVAIWPLLSNNLIVDHVTISGFKAKVLRNKQGQFNFHDLMAQDVRLLERPADAAQAVTGAVVQGGQAAADAAGGAPAAGASDMRIDIAGLDMKDGELLLQDEMTGMAVAVSQLNATTGRVTFSQPFDVSMSAHIEGGNPRVDAGITGQALLKLDPSTKHYSAQRMDIRIDGKLADAQVKNLGARGNMAFNGNTGKLDVAGLEVVFQGDLSNPARPMSNVEASVAMPRLVIDPHKSEFQIEKLAVRAKGGLAQGPFELAMDAPGLSISPASATGAALTGRLKLDGANGMDAGFAFTGISGNASDLDVNEVKVNGTIKQGDRTIAIGAASPLNLNLVGRVIALQALRGDVTITDPGLPKGSLQIPIIGTVGADFIKDEANTQLNAVLEGGKFDLTAHIAGLTNTPAAKFALAVDILDLDKLAPPRGAMPVIKPPVGGDGKTDGKTDGKIDNAAKGAGSGAVDLPDDTIDLSSLVGPKADGTIKVGRLVARGVKAENLSAAIKLEAGKLDVASLAAALYGGTLAGSFSVDAAHDNALAAKLALAGISVGPLLTDVAQQSSLTGVGNVDIDMKSAGSNPYALKNNLAGTLQLRLRDGAVKGIDVAQTLRELKAAVLAARQEGEAEVPADQARQTDFTQMDADLSFAAGIGTVKRLDMVSPLLRVTQGSPAIIDLPKAAVDLVANIRMADAPPAGQGLDDLKGIAVPVHITGAYDQLKYRVDWRAMAADAVSRALQRTLKDAVSGRKNGKSKDGALKDLGNVLKGITGK